MKHVPSLVAITGSFLAGCSGPTGGEPGDAAVLAPEGVEGGYGLVVLSHEVDDPGVQVSGQFVHYRGPTRAQVLHALALPEQAWLVGEAPPPGECRPVSVRPADLDDGGSIDLLGAGELRVTPPGDAAAPLVLAPREFPHVHFAISGVVYDAHAPEALPFEAGGVYRVEAGGETVGGFEQSVRAPAALRIRIVEVDEAGLHVEWEQAGAAVVTLSRDVGSRTVGVQCAADRDDAADVPWEALRALAPGDVQLTVARVTAVPLRAPELDEGDLVFVSRDTTEVRLPAGAGPDDLAD